MIPPLTPLDRLRLFHSCDELALSPRYVVFEITRRMDEVGPPWGRFESTEDSDELSTYEVRQLIDQLKEFPSPPTLVICGGDPLARRDIYEVIEYAKNCGVLVEVRVVATSSTRSALRGLYSAGVGNLSIRLDGADAASHDERHGAGSFRRTLEVLVDARDIGIATQVDTHVRSPSVSALAAIADMLPQLNVGVWSVNFPVPADDELPLTHDQREQIYGRLWELSQSLPLAVRAVSAPHYSRYIVQHQHPGDLPSRFPMPQRSPLAYIPPRINDGRGTMFVTRAGLVCPSEALRIVCGVFPMCRLAEVYEKSPVFQGLHDTNRVEGKCGRCEFRHMCGGSRAHAYAKTANPYAQDPVCAYVPVDNA